MKILLTGGTGFIGSALRSFLADRGHAVTILSRHPPSMGGDWIPWDPEAHAIRTTGLEGHDAVIHLAGANIAERRWTGGRREILRQSRIVSTDLLVHSLRKLNSPPRLFLGGSAVGYYGFNSSDEVDESSPPGRGFLADLCRGWESASSRAGEFGARVAFMRFGVVLHPSGGMLKKLLPIYRWGLGGPLGNGRQFISWIALEDLVRAVLFLLTNSLSGPVNVTSPTPISNREFSKTLRRFFRRPAIFPVPAMALRIVYGDLAQEILLGGQKAVPHKLLGHHFQFKHPTLESLFPQTDASPSRIT